MPARLPWHAGHVERNASLAVARGACSRPFPATRIAADAGPVAAPHRVISCRPHAPAVAARLLLDSARAFDARAAGTVSGSGAAAVVLKRLSDARDDGDNVLAVIKGSAINNDGSGKAGYTAPSTEGQARVILAAQAAAGVAADSIGYVEAHGTGTALGDPIEIAALRQVFQAGTSDRGFCRLGSLKANLGHLDAAHRAQVQAKRLQPAA